MCLQAGATANGRTARGPQPARLSRDAPRHPAGRPLPAARRVAWPVIRARRQARLHQLLQRHRQRQPGHPVDPPDHGHRLGRRGQPPARVRRGHCHALPPTGRSSMAPSRLPGRRSTPRPGRSCAIGCWPAHRQEPEPAVTSSTPRCAGGRCSARTSAGSHTAEGGRRPATRRCRLWAQIRPTRRGGRGRRR